MIRRPPRSTPFPTRRSSDLEVQAQIAELPQVELPDYKDLIKSALATLKKDATKQEDRKSTRLNSSHTVISYAVFCLKKKKRSHILSQLCPVSSNYRVENRST